MRLIYLANGSSSHTIKWLAHMRDAGHELTLISFEDCPVLGIEVHKLRSFFLGRFRYITQARSVAKFIHSRKPDLVHAHYAGGYGFLGALANYHPLVLSVWGSDVYDFPNRSAVHRKVSQFVCEKADHICCTGLALASRAKTLTGKHVEITPFGVDCKAFVPKVRRVSAGVSAELIFGTVKSLHRNYGIDYLLRAFAVLKKTYCGPETVRLIICGRGPHEAEFKSLADSLGITSAVEFTGYVDPVRVPQVIQKFDVFACLSSVEESFGVSILEASACGVPVIASAVGGLFETVVSGVTGLMVVSRDVEHAAGAMSRLAKDEGLRHRMGAAGRKWVEATYDWRNTALQMERVYAKAMSSGRPGVSGAPASIKPPAGGVSGSQLSPPVHAANPGLEASDLQ